MQFKFQTSNKMTVHIRTSYAITTLCLYIYIYTEEYTKCNKKDKNLYNNLRCSLFSF